MVAVIPARGGSKGIPRKNLMPVGGKPLIAWTIEQALAVPGLATYVSTEDEEIAEVSRSFGARVLVRSDDLARDETPTEPVICEALKQLAQTGHMPEAVMLLQATSPVRLPGTLARARAEFETRDVNSLVGVVSCPPFLWAESAEGAEALWDWRHRKRRQDFACHQLRYRETGSVYVTDSSLYLETENRMGGKIGLFHMADVEGIDIDTLDDAGVAEATLRRIALAETLSSHSNSPDGPDFVPVLKSGTQGAGDDNQNPTTGPKTAARRAGRRLTDQSR